MANRLRLQLANVPATTVEPAAVISGGGALPSGSVTFAVIAWYNDGDESKLLNAAALKLGWPIYNILQGQQIIDSIPIWTPVTVATGDAVQLQWDRPRRAGRAAPDVHHYSIHVQRVTTIYQIAQPGNKVAVDGYPDGNIPPWVTSAVVKNITSLATATSAVVQRFDTDRNAFWIDGDHRVSLGKGADITLATGGYSNHGLRTVDWSDLEFSLRGPQTVVSVVETVQPEIISTSKTLTYQQGPATLMQHSSSFNRKWGPQEYIDLSPVLQITPSPRDPYYAGFDGLLSSASYGIDLVDEGLAVTLGKTGCTAWEWAYMRHWLRSRARLWMFDECEEYDEYTDGKSTRWGYGGNSRWAGYITGLAYLGNSGKNRRGEFGFTFLIEEEL